jgi:hypothetical protein
MFIILIAIENIGNFIIKKKFNLNFKYLSQLKIIKILIIF